MRYSVFYSQREYLKQFTKTKNENGEQANGNQEVFLVKICAGFIFAYDGQVCALFTISEFLTVWKKCSSAI